MGLKRSVNDAVIVPFFQEEHAIRRVVAVSRDGRVVVEAIRHGLYYLEPKFGEWPCVGRFVRWLGLFWRFQAEGGDRPSELENVSLRYSLPRGLVKTNSEVRDLPATSACEIFGWMNNGEVDRGDTGRTAGRS